MTQEDKELLLKDLSARLPYGVKVQVTQVPIGLSKDETLTYNRMYSLDESDEYITIKPYLHPLSSMTKKETKELFKDIGFEFTCNTCGIPAHYNYEFAEQIKGIPTITNVEFIKVIDWLNKKMFDYRGLIEEGLAITVTKENNPYERID